MLRMQIQLDPAQAEAVRQAARRERVSQAEIVRRAVDSYLGSKLAPDRAELQARALAVIGAFRGDVSDLSDRHDHYFAEAAGEHGVQTDEEPLSK